MFCSKFKHLRAVGYLFYMYQLSFYTKNSKKRRLEIISMRLEICGNPDTY